MNPDRDRLIEELFDSTEELIVEELCGYQSRLDQCEPRDTDQVVGSDFVVEPPPVIKDCRNFLDFLHEVRSQTGFPTKESVAAKNLAGYALPTRIGRFKILEQLGFGGFGVIFRGVDPVIGREVAIKIPRPEFLETPEFIDRFAREASIVAQLAHPNIVSIFESGCYEIVPYIVMPYVSGKTLSEWRAVEPDVSPRKAAKIVHQLAMAVAHAHEHGVLHRDLKPGNVILAQRNSNGSGDELAFTPMLTDFGMARCVGIDSPHTRAGALIGTSYYMSPEQAEGRIQDITARTDVYGLGAILYELLTGTPPFKTTNERQTLQRVLQDEPHSLRSIRPAIPIDLEVICLKCLEKEPANRYSSAEAVVHDLQRFLDGDPIRARPISRIARAKKWIRRYPTSAATIALGIFGVLALISVSLWYNSRLITLLEDAEAQRAFARRSELSTRRRAYDSDMRNAKIALDRGNVSLMLRFLERQAPHVGETDIRDFAWWALWRESNEASRLLGIHEGEATAVSVTRSGNLAASGGADSTIRLWSIPAGTLLAELRGHGLGAVESLSFSPNGQRLASAGKDGTVRVWDLAKMKEVFIRRDHASPVFDVAYSPRGDIIASAGGDKMIRLWDANHGAPAGVLSGHTEKVLCLAFHPTEDTLASGGADATIRLWDLCDRCPDSRIHGGAIQFAKPNQWPRALIFEHSGKSLLVGTATSETYQFNLEAQSYGKILSRQTERANALSFAWPRDGSPIIGLGNSEIRVADRFDPGALGELRRGHLSAVLSIATPDDGSFLISSAHDGQVRYWPQFQTHSRIAIGAQDGASCEPDPGLYAVQWQDRFLAADFQQDQVAIFRMPERKLERTFPKANNDNFVLSPSGRFLLTHGRDGRVTCYRVETGGAIWTSQLSPPPQHTRADSCAIDKSDDIAMLASADELLVISMQSSEIMHRLDHPENVNRVLSIGEGKALSTCHDDILRIWDVRKGKLLKQLNIHSSLISSLAVSNDHRLLAVAIGGDNPLVKIWRVDDLALIAVVPIPSQLATTDFENNKVAFLTPTKIVVRSDWGMSLWDIQDEAELMAFPEFDRVGALAISSDCQQIAIPQRDWIRLIDGSPQLNATTR